MKIFLKFAPCYFYLVHAMGERNSEMLEMFILLHYPTIFAPMIRGILAKFALPIYKIA